MNFSSLLGIIIAFIVFFTALFTSTDSREIFLDKHGILIVFGGTAAASLMCFPLSKFLMIMGVFVKKFIGSYSKRHEVVIEEIVELAKGYRTNPAHLSSAVGTIKTPFLKDAIELIIKGGISEQSIYDILQKRAATDAKNHDDEAAIFKTLAKFPPAFGLMGTTLGMISLMQKMGSPDAYKTLGPSMAIGLVATLYGITLANLVFIPIGENLSKLNREDEVLRELVIDGMKLLQAKEHPLVISEFLKSYLSPKDRIKMKKLNVGA